MAYQKFAIFKNLKCDISEQYVKIGITLIFFVNFSCELASNAHKNLKYTRLFNYTTMPVLIMSGVSLCDPPFEHQLL